MTGVPERSALALVALAIAIAAASTAGSQEASPKAPFADADMQPASRARCADLRRLTEGVETGAKRIDLAVEGELTIIHSDGVLTYLGLCRSPEPQVLCVTYSDNGMKLSNRVTLAGGYSRPDADHILLDPCLASPADETSD
jgi:hypothetical protein